MIQKKIVLADMHWGAINPKRFYEEIQDCLFKRIEKMDFLDDIIIAGDLYDTKEYFTSDVNYYVSKFIGKLLSLTDKFSTSIYIVEGTRSHDNHQPDMIFNIMSNLMVKDDSYKRIHVINNVTEIDNMLFIPEEYVMDWDEYYKEFFRKKYDFIFGHGMIDKIQYAKKRSDESKRLSAPTFPVEKLLDVGNYVYFGHIHKHERYGKNKHFQYVGPLTRWEFGNESDCGYIYLKYDTKTKELFEEFVVNDLAPILTTRVLNITDSLELREINDMIDEIISQEMTYAERLRIIVNIKSNLQRYNEIRDFIISKIGNYRFIKLVLNTEDVSEETMEQLKTELEANSVAKSYVFDKNLRAENKIHEFIKAHSGKIITVDKIKKYLDESLEKH